MGRVGGGAVRGRSAAALGFDAAHARRAEQRHGRHLDADDYYWIATDPPFTTRRTPAARVAAIERDVAELDDWVLSGSVSSWGDPLLTRFTVAVFLRLDPEVRMVRLVERERARYGPRILPGGDMHAHHVAFMDWARSYDHARAPVRSLDLHERWMVRLPCPVLRLDARRPVEALCDAVVASLGAAHGGG